MTLLDLIAVFETRQQHNYADDSWINLKIKLWNIWIKKNFFQISFAQVVNTVVTYSWSLQLTWHKLNCHTMSYSLFKPWSKDLNDVIVWSILLFLFAGLCSLLKKYITQTFNNFTNKKSMGHINNITIPCNSLLGNICYVEPLWGLSVVLCFFVGFNNLESKLY